MPINFPISPSNGQSFTSGTRTWVYDAANQAWNGGNIAPLTFTNIAVSGQNTIIASSSSDTLNIANGSNILVTTNNVTDTLTITATGLATTSSFNSFTSSYSVASSSFAVGIDSKLNTSSFNLFTSSFNLYTSSISASAIIFTPSGNLDSTNVQNALVELDTDKQVKIYYSDTKPLNPQEKDEWYDTSTGARLIRSGSVWIENCGVSQAYNDTPFNFTNVVTMSFDQYNSIAPDSNTLYLILSP